MNPRTTSRPLRGLLALAPLTFALTIVTVACDDEAAEPPPPTPSFAPSPVDFGRVSVVQERTIDLVVSNEAGGRPYRITTANVRGNEDKFSLGSLPAVLTESPGLGIGETATISVTFRPCEAALEDPGAVNGCDLAQQSATLEIVDNSQAGNSEIALQGVATGTPNLSVRCWARCDNSETLGQCSVINFSDVPVGESCEIQVELTNEDVDGTPVADALIERVAIRVADQASVGGTVLEGAEAGFELRSVPDGAPLNPTFDNPITVAIPPGASSATTRFSILFTPPADGDYIGFRDQGNGLSLTYNDPAEPRLDYTVLASGVGPRFEVVNDAGDRGVFQLEAGQLVQFRDVVAGQEATTIIRLSNNGRAPMTIGPITLENADSEFTMTYDSGESLDDVITLPPLGEGDIDRELTVTYAPEDDEPDNDALLIACSTPACEPAFEVQIAGGAFPLLEPSPPTVFFSSEASNEVCQEVTLTNAGDAELVISQLEITPASDGSGSVDDFYVKLPECGSGVASCAVDISIAAADPDASEKFEVCFLNNDTSASDSANLEITSNDPAALGGVRAIGLSATDRPCLGPQSAEAIVNPEPVCAGVGGTLDLTGVADRPGGPEGVDGVLSQCTVSIDFGEDFPLNPNPVTAADSWQMPFNPASTGNRIFGITCINNCGAETESQVFFGVVNCP